MTQNPRGIHLATVAHEGRIWDVYLEQDDATAVRDAVRARLRFSSTEADRFYRTAAIIIEPSWEEAAARARALEEHQLSGLLRSVLPETQGGEGTAG